MSHAAVGSAGAIGGAPGRVAPGLVAPGLVAPRGEVPIDAGDVSAGAAPVVLACHGSRDPRSADTMSAVAAAVGRRRVGPVEAAFLDFNAPSIPATLRRFEELGAGVTPVVVPALLTHAYHGRVDLPEVLRATGQPVRMTPVLGPAGPDDRPSPWLLGALAQRVSEMDIQFDGLVLIAAGTSHAGARSTVEGVAVELGGLLNAPCRVGYASAASPDAGDAVADVRAAGATRIVAASYFLAAGRLYEAAAGAARAAGALGVAEPIGTADGLVELILDRVTAVTS